MQVLLSAVHSDNRVQKGQTPAMDILQCLRKYGQRLDSDIAEETGIALATVRERFALLTGEVITCQLTRFENGKPVEACLYRASGYFPPPAPGRKPKPLA
jgi:transcription initiation factor IIE alpha subunit